MVNTATSGGEWIKTNYCPKHKINYYHPWGDICPTCNDEYFMRKVGWLPQV